MSFFKPAAKRNPTPASATGVASATPPGPATIESLGQQLREALPTRRLQSLSLCDHEANVLWLSEGALGPDEHSLVVEALAVLAADTSLVCHEMVTEDGRLALFLPVRAPVGNPVGIAMVLADRKAVGDDTLERMGAAPVRAIMQRLAVLLKPAQARTAAGNAPAPVSDIDVEVVAAPAPPAVGRIPTVSAAAAPPPAEAPSAIISPEQIDDILEFDMDAEPAQAIAAVKAVAGGTIVLELEDTHAGPGGDIDMLALDFTPPAPKGPAARAPTPAPAPAPAPARRAVPPPPAPVAVAPPAPAAVAARANPPPRPAAPAARIVTPVPAPPAPPAAPAVAVGAAAAAAALANDPNLLLELLPFAKLRAGGQTRRFQVLARASAQQRDPAAFDALVLQRLLGWLAAHRASWTSQPTSFTVNLSIATLEDERFAQKMAATLNTHGIAADGIGFEITEALCTQRRAQVERFIAQCDKVGSWVVIDDFSFDSQVLPLLKSKAVRLVKIDPKLSSNALKDKLCQALVVATVQAAKVLGIHCSAKKVDSQAALQWLTAIGCDFAQGQALARPQPLDALASSPDPTGISAMAMPT